MEEDVEIEFRVAEVQIAVGEKQSVATNAVVVKLEGGVVAAAAEGAFDRGGETIRCVLRGEETGVRRTVEGPAANEGRERSDGDAGKVGVGRGGDVVTGE